MYFEEQQLNKNIPVPMYFQLKELILNAIRSGVCPKGSMIPTEKEFSDMYAISRTTVRQAVTELVHEGWLYRVKSKGTFVSEPKIRQDFIQRLETYADQMRRLGMKPSTEVLDLKVMRATEIVSSMLEIAPGEKVVYLHRRRFANSEPIVTVETYLPYSKCAYVMEHNLRDESLYDIMSAREETRVYGIHRKVEAVEATSADARNMDMKKGKPIHLFYSIGKNTYGQPVEYSIARYRGDRNSFEVTILAQTSNP